MQLLQSLMRGDQQLTVRIDEHLLTLTQATALAEQRAKAGQGRQAEHIFNQLLAQATEWHREKRLDDAEAVYRQVFEAEPSYIDALHLLGVIYSQRGDHQTAERQNHSHVLACNNLGKVFSELKRWPEAVASFRRAVALRPDYAEARGNLEEALRQQEFFNKP
ncbi:MAG: tetratricopeptide repeat protein [Candidatus Competibacteraceae bacterium]|nr:tetratricopeptide repeat protein [Candidatus Competibacteraceae bacterium]